MEPIHIDGAEGEGGGQVLRSSLALSLATGRPIVLEKIRAGRTRPGLRRQHLTAVRAATEIGRALVDGAELGSQHLSFAPTTIAGGEYTFAIGTAGSTTLVLQTILLALLAAEEPSVVRIEGGTHNPGAPPFDFLAGSYLPRLRGLGAQVDLILERPGFYPAGGGALTLHVRPGGTLRPIEATERGEVGGIRGRIWLSALPEGIVEREARRMTEGLGLERRDVEIERVADPAGPGNVVIVEVETEGGTEVFSAFGQVGVPAETVASRVVAEVRAYLGCPAVVGPHLADQLLLPLALGAGGRFRTMAPTSHTRTHATLIERFLPVRIRETRHGRDDHEIEVEAET